MDWIYPGLIFLGILLGLYIALLVFSFVLLYKKTLSPTKRGYEWSFVLSFQHLGFVQDQDFQEFFISVPSKGTEINLHTIYLPPGSKQNELSEYTVVLSHMFQRRKENLLGVGLSLHKMGYGVVLYDFRGHGLSTPCVNSLADDKHPDLAAIIDWIKKNVYPKSKPKIILHGFSMGASVSLRAGASIAGIVAVILDSPYLDIRQVLAYHIRRKFKLPASILLPVHTWLVKMLWGFSLTDNFHADIKALAQKQIPALLIYGKNDHVVPQTQQQQMRQWFSEHNNSTDFQVWLCEHSGHYGCFFQNPDQYAQKIGIFLKSMHQSIH